MKTKHKILAIALGMVVFISGQPSTCLAGGAYEEKASDILTDVIVYRPAGIILLAGGTAIFLATLPFTAIVGGTKHTGRTMVGTPFNATFRRPLGTDMRSYMGEDPFWD